MTSEQLQVFCMNNEYFTDSGHSCAVCQKEVNDPTALVIHEWTRLGAYISSILHLDCRKKWVQHPLSLRQVRSVVNVTNARPVGSFLVMPRPPALATSRADSTDDWLSLANKQAETSTDRTVHSLKHESLEGAIVGNQHIIEDIRDKWDEVNADPAGFLQEEKRLSEKAAIEQRKTNLIDEVQR